MTDATSSSVPSSDAPPPTVWTCLSYTDADAAVRFLVDVVGFDETLVVPGEAEGSARSIVHAELRWPEGGGVMLGSFDPDESSFSSRPVGVSSTYVVTDDPHAVHARAVAAGAAIVKAMESTDYGSTGFSLADPEGNLWSFGTYRGA